MAKINVTGSAAVITSTLKLEDLKLVNKYRPEALTLMGGEDNKEELFTIGVSETPNPGAINRFGAIFGTETRDEEKKAVITMMIDTNGIDNNKIKESIADGFGSAMMYIGKLEAAIPAVVEEIRKERESIMAGITVG